ncbi:MAG TPA: prolyl oligopeptidase family serine peptidase [Solirubrobacteraceae bacterium]|nr:prolyl oligopeptidase family serine peptidase [Solirubrobacteraceae bacterium]
MFKPSVVAGGVERTEVFAGDGGVWWLEHSYDEGRSYVVHAPHGDVARRVTPESVDVGTLAWEYGGGSYLVTASGAVVYSDRDDQRLYRVLAGGSPSPLTPPAPSARAVRFADGSVSADGRWAAYVHESHRLGEPVRHELVAVSLDGSWTPRGLATGEDFYAAPRVSPDGSRLAWLSWRKPQMPWDGTELWLAEIRADLSLDGPRRIAGGATESVLAPAWSPDGTLHWVSDASGWWNLYALRDSVARPVCPDTAEYAVPPWQHGRRGYGFLADGSIAAVRIRDAVHELVRIDPAAGALKPLARDLTWIADGHLSCHGNTVALAGATPTSDVAVFAVNARDGRITTIASEAPASDLVSAGTPLWINAGDGLEVHGFWYEPAARSRPPLILQLHGGPTDGARLAFDPELQLWTSRGFAVLDLNYSGSTGFGSAYRHRLDGEWGERDFADCLAAVAYLARERLVDPKRVFARGASAGGYLTLRCITGSTVFAGGMARCGISDLALWRDDAHDFESRYTDLLVGPPSELERYHRRSPARNVGPRSAPVLLIHGLGDAVVPPEHSALMAAAYRGAGRPCALELLPDEPHGLRRRTSRERWLEAELTFIERSERG